MLDGRIHVSPKGVCLVFGKPHFEQLLHCLQSINEVPRPGDEPGPIQLGFEPDQVTPVTSELLADCGRALQKWRKILSERCKPSSKKIASRQELKQWKAEADFLGKRLDCLHHHLKSYHAGSEVSSLYVPSDSTRVDVSELIRHTVPAKHVPRLWQWYGLVAAWIAGSTTLTRFLASLKPVLLTPQEHERLEWLLFAQELFSKWQSYLQGSQKKSGHKLLNRSLKEDIQAELNALPPHILEDIGLGFPGRPSELPGYVEHSLRMCQEARAGLPSLPNDQQIAGIASLCAYDSCTSPIPHSLVAQPITVEKLNPVLNALARVSSESGYQTLLGEFDLIGISVSPSLIPILHNMLRAGANGHDMIWLLDQGLNWQALQNLSERQFSPTPLRHFIELMQAMGAKCEDREIAQAIDDLGKSGYHVVLKAFTRWTELLRFKGLESNVVQGIWNSFLEALSLGSLGDRPTSILHQWSKPLTTVATIPGVPSHLENSEFRQWLDQLAFYQKLAGRRPALTKSLARLLCRAEHEEKEVYYLKRKDLEGTLDGAARCRFHALESRPRSELKPDVKILQQVQEVCAHTALEAVKTLVKAEIERQWQDFCGAEPEIPLKPMEKLIILHWAKSLEGPALHKLEEMLSAWKHHALEYRSRLKGNQAWLRHLRSRRMHMATWLCPQPMTCSIGTSDIRLEVAANPFRIFLMGLPFESCLNLRDGTHRNAVLANAYEANKAVLFALDDCGNILGRKLVGINNRFELVGFRTYVSHPDEGCRESLSAKMNAYCGAWAKACGLALSNSGSVRSLASLDWYDDGLEAWSLDALRSWTSGQVITEGTDSPQVSPLSEAAQRHWPACRELLKSIDLCPPPEGQNPQTLLAETPELMEELLALVAEEKLDHDLLQTLRQWSATKGGIMRTFKASLTIEGCDAIEDIHDAQGRAALGMDGKLAGLLAECGTRKATEGLCSLCLQSLRATPSNLLAAARRSPEAARTIADFLKQERYWHCRSDFLLFLSQAIVDTSETPLSDRLLWKLFSHDNRERPDLGTVSPPLALSMAQWLPPLQNPSRCVKLKELEAMWDSFPLQGTTQEYIRDTRSGIVIWCLRNPCQISVRFLRNHSGADQSALLALAILAGKRFERHIEKAYEVDPDNPAIIMSLVHIKGDSESITWAKSATSKMSMNTKLFQSIRKLYRAYGELDWEEIDRLFKKLKGYDLRPCLPLLMWNIWQQTESRCETEPDQPRDHASKAKTLKKTGLDLFGYCLKLSALLPSQDVSRRKKSKFAVNTLANTIMLPLWSELYLWLNDSLDGQLFDAEFMHAHNVCFDFDSDIAFSHAYDFFFDQSGNRRSLCHIPWDDTYLPTVFPFSISQADKLAKLIVEKVDSDEIEDILDTEPISKIEKMLIQHHLGRNEE